MEPAARVRPVPSGRSALWRKHAYGPERGVPGKVSGFPLHEAQRMLSSTKDPRIELPQSLSPALLGEDARATMLLFTAPDRKRDVGGLNGN